MLPLSACSWAAPALWGVVPQPARCMDQSGTCRREPFSRVRQAYAAVPVLYASQWLLTCFACPFSAPVACRVIDALLIENRPHCLLRVALALLAELEPDLLALDDFEELITFIKACHELPG